MEEYSKLRSPYIVTIANKEIELNSIMSAPIVSSERCVLFLRFVLAILTTKYQVVKCEVYAAYEHDYHVVWFILAFHTLNTAVNATTLTSL